MAARAEPHRSWRTAIGTLSGALAIGAAVWLVPASIAIVQWPGNGPTRLALLLPAWQLAAALAAAFAIGVVAHLRGWGISVWLASSWLWLWAVPYLPWLPDRLPLLLLLAGPVRWAIPIAIAVWALSRSDVSQRICSGILSAGRRTVFLTSLAVYALGAVWAVSAQGVIGDEPHYLIISDSLLRDGDLQIENNHQRRDYRAYFGGDLRPDYMTRGKNGAIYSIHAPGLPALILPVYAVAGRYGAAMFVAFLAALAALAVFDLARLLAGQAIAILTWLGVCFTVPFIPYAWAIFPEMPGTLLSAWAVLWLWQTADRRPVIWLLRGMALAAYPWLHTKFAVFLGVYGLAHAWRLRRSPWALAAFSLPIGLSGLLWLYSFYAIYGVVNPEAPYGNYADSFILFRNIPHGLIGFFFDQKFGLLFYCPLYLASIGGAWLMWKRPGWRFQTATLVFVVALFVGSTARLYMFWGGASAPARFLVPLLPCFAPMVAVALAHASSALSRAILGAWFAIGLSVAAVAFLLPQQLLLYSDPHGRARILELIQAGSPLALVIPTFTDPDWADHVVPLFGWLAPGAAGLALAWTVARAHTSAWPAAGTVCVALLLGGAAVSPRPSAAVREETARRGAIDVLTRFDGDRFRTLDYRSLSRTTPDRLRELTTIDAALPAASSEGETVTAPVTLPAGAYDARIWFDSARARSGRVRVAALRQATFAEQSGGLSNPTTMPFMLPVDVGRVTVGIEGEGLPVGVSRVQIIPRSIIPPPERSPLPVRLVESVRDREGAYLAYTDEHAYPENGIFWTRGTASTTVYVVPNGARRLMLQLSTGPMSGNVQVSVRGTPQEIAMVGDQAKTVSFDLAPGERLVPVTVQSSVMFRPGEVDPATRDLRGLGCQVFVILE